MSPVTLSRQTHHSLLNTIWGLKDSLGLVTRLRNSQVRSAILPHALGQGWSEFPQAKAQDITGGPNKLKAQTRPDHSQPSRFPARLVSSARVLFCNRRSSWYDRKAGKDEKLSSHNPGLGTF
jgi:hypothetical protein